MAKSVKLDPWGQVSTPPLPRVIPLVIIDLMGLMWGQGQKYPPADSAEGGSWALSVTLQVLGLRTRCSWAAWNRREDLAGSVPAAQADFSAPFATPPGCPLSLCLAHPLCCSAVHRAHGFPAPISKYRISTLTFSLGNCLRFTFPSPKGI